MSKLSKFSLVLGMSLLLSACGGGGSGTEPDGDNGNPDPGTGGGEQSTLQQEFAKWLEDMSSNHIEAGYQALLADSQMLNQQVATFCALTSPSQSDLTALEQKWLAASQKWQSIQWLKVGPIIDESRIFRFQFWPDSNDAVAKGVRTLLARQEVVTSEYVSGRNVGAQGFPALETLIFADEPQTSLLTAHNKQKRCEVLSAISANVSNMADEVVTAWSATGGNYRTRFVEGTGEFSGQVDVVEEVVTNWLEQLERIKDEKMLTPSAEGPPGLPLMAESHISDTSLQNIKTNINSLIAIYTANDGHGFDDILNDHLEQGTIATEMLEALTRAQSKINELSGSYDSALNQEQSRAVLQEVIEALRDFRTVLSADFIQAMDINIGFNSNDGD